MRRGHIPYLQIRQTVWHFRFQFPGPIRALAGRSEIRLSLNTTELSIARERVAKVLPHVYSLRRLCKKHMELTSDESRRAITFAVKRIVETLEGWDEPWLSSESESPEHTEVALFERALGFRANVKAATNMQAWIAGVDIDAEDESVADLAGAARNTVTKCGGSALARCVLKTLGIEFKEDSKLFLGLSIEMGKLHVALRRVLAARSRGDYSAEERFINYYRRNGYAPDEKESPKKTTPAISEAWKNYLSEKTSGPKPEWNEKTARGQEAAFIDFQEIIGNIPVGEITRDTMLRYRTDIARLPSSRKKRYPGKTIAELLQIDIPEDCRPSNRTVQERLIQIGSFLKWCRETKNYLSVDPMIGVHFEASSQSYAPFTQQDLKKLFNSKEYESGEHSQSWQYWIPLIALYSGARQAEIAQLSVRDVVQEDGIWIFVITDAGEDQKVKTSAGIRKVPVSSKLMQLGFLDYVAFLKTRGETRLFPDLKKGPYGWGDKVSRWFGNVYKKNAGIESDVTGRRKVFHSFRHTAITKALDKGQAMLTHNQQVFGHEKSLLGETATYMGAFPVKSLVPVIEALDYGLDHSAYKDSWRKYVVRWSPVTSASVPVDTDQAD